MKILSQPDINAVFAINYCLQRIEAVRRWISLGLSQDGGWTDFDVILGAKCLKGGLSIVTTFDPCHFSLDTLFKLDGHGAGVSGWPFCRLAQPRF